MYLDVGDPFFGLLTRIDNGMGGVTGIAYRTSTSYLVESKQDQQPWLTPLVRGMPLIAEMRTTDSLHLLGMRASETVALYSYRDGYFDTREREFRGFARVRVTSVGAESARDAGDGHSLPRGSEPGDGRGRGGAQGEAVHPGGDEQRGGDLQHGRDAVGGEVAVPGGSVAGAREVVSGLRALHRPAGAQGRAHRARGADRGADWSVGAAEHAEVHVDGAGVRPLGKYHCDGCVGRGELRERAHDWERRAGDERCPGGRGAHARHVPQPRRARTRALAHRPPERAVGVGRERRCAEPQGDVLRRRGRLRVGGIRGDERARVGAR